MMQKKLAWMADGYRYDKFKSPHRYPGSSSVSVVSTDSMKFINILSDINRDVPEMNIIGGSALTQKRRVKSATAYRMQEKEKEAPPPPAKKTEYRRPVSAHPRIQTVRPQSGRSVTSTLSYQSDPTKRSVKNLHKSFSMVNRWLHEFKYQAEIHADPDHRYFDRHARCHGYTHTHGDLYRSHPQTACQECRTTTPSHKTLIDATRPHSAAAKSRSKHASAVEIAQQILVAVPTAHARYTGAHRPRTAPITRRERQLLPKHNHVLRGDTPHFCNFVQRVGLKDRTFTPPVPESHSHLHGKQGHEQMVDDHPAEARPSSPSSVDFDLTSRKDLADYESDLQQYDAVTDPSEGFSEKFSIPDAIRIPTPQPLEEEIEDSGRRPPTKAWDEFPVPEIQVPSPILDHMSPPSTPPPPPPSPKPSTEKPPKMQIPPKQSPPKEDTSSKKNRSCMKKERKPDARRVRHRDSEERASSSPTAVTIETPPASPQPSPVPSASDETEKDKASVSPPDLPLLPQHVPKQPAEPKKLAKPVMTHIEVDLFKPTAQDLLEEALRSKRRTFEINIPSDTMEEQVSKLTNKDEYKNRNLRRFRKPNFRLRRLLEEQVKQMKSQQHIRRNKREQHQERASQRSRSSASSCLHLYDGSFAAMFHLPHPDTSLLSLQSDNLNVACLLEGDDNSTEWKLARRNSLDIQLCSSKPFVRVTQPKTWTPEQALEKLSTSQVNELGGRESITRAIDCRSKERYEDRWRSSDQSDFYFDEPKNRAQPWIHGRLALSQQACRFELPMDMKVLETMSPENYLRQFCVISSRRQVLYQRTFLKHKDKAGHISPKEMEKALSDVLVNTINGQDLQKIFTLVQLTEESKIDFKLFCGISAMAERMLYPKFLTDDTVDLSDHQKEKIECADFCALDWKFHGVDVNPPVRRIIEAL